MSMSLPRARSGGSNAQHAQAVIEIRAEAPGLDRAVEIHVRRRDDPHVDRDRFLSAEPLDLPSLQEAQQARLALDRHVADLVEKQRTAVRRFDPAHAPLVRAGERAALIAEQLRLQQVMRNRPAVDRDERPLAAAGTLVNRERRQFLAGARLAGDEYARVGLRDLADRAEQLLHRLAVADHAVLADRRRIGCAVDAVERGHPARMAEHMRNPFVGQRQRHVIETIAANQFAHGGTDRDAGLRDRNPADSGLAQARFQRRIVARREPREIDQPGGDDYAGCHVLRGAGCLRDRDLPAEPPQLRKQRLVGRTHDHEQLAAGLWSGDGHGRRLGRRIPVCVG